MGSDGIGADGTGGVYVVFHARRAGDGGSWRIRPPAN